MWKAGLDGAQAGIKIAERNISNLNMQMTPPLFRKQRGTKEPLDENERGRWKSWLKTHHSKNENHGIQSHHFMANRWGNNGNSDRLFFLSSKITENGDCSHEIKRHLLLGRKAMTNLDSVLKNREVTLLTKVHIIKAMVSPVVMWELDHEEDWESKNWSFSTVVLEKTLEWFLGMQDQTSQS